MIDVVCLPNYFHTTDTANPFNAIDSHRYIYELLYKRVISYICTAYISDFNQAKTKIYCDLHSLWVVPDASFVGFA